MHDGHQHPRAYNLKPVKQPVGNTQKFGFRNQAHEFIAVYYRKAADFMFLHQFHGIKDIGILSDGDRVFDHDLGHCGIFL